MLVTDTGEAISIAKDVLCTNVGEWPYKHDELMTLARAVLDQQPPDRCAWCQMLETHRDPGDVVRIIELEERVQELERMVAGLESADEAIAILDRTNQQRVATLTVALRSLIARVRAVGGYARIDV